MNFSRFDYGALHEDQRARLGIEITDINGERWGYVRLREAIGYGEVVRSSKHADLVTTDPGEANAAAAAGTDRLPTSDGFLLSSAEIDLRGCLGYISDGAGIGQQFYILENDDDTAKVFVLTGNTNVNRNQGWVTALDSTSRFLLFFPGEARQGGGVSDLVEGVMQARGGADASDIGKFCWVKRSGLTPVKVDGSGTDLTAGGIVVPTAAGLSHGSTSSARGIGRALEATSYGDAEDYLALVTLDIPTGPLSFAYASTKNAFNEVVIR